MARKLLFVLLLCCLALAQEPEVIRTGYAKVNVRIHGTAVENQTVYVPSNDERQAVVYPKDLYWMRDAGGNDFTLVEEDYSLEFVVYVNATKLSITKDQFLPVAERVQEEFLGDSRYILSNDYQVVRKAREITAGSVTVLEAIAALAGWVHENVEYDTKYESMILSSIEVYRNRKGVCSEFTNLYTAMARSLNIPTRVVTGMIYTGSMWQRHAWAESYAAGQWVPVDPTFGEAITLNAMKVKLYTAPSYLYYLKPGSQERVEVTLLENDVFSLPLEEVVELSESVVGSRQLFSLSARVKNAGHGIIAPCLFVQKTLGIESITPQKQVVVLRPGQVKTVEWEFVAPYGERDVYYLVYNSPNSESKLELKVDKTRETEKQACVNILETYTRVEKKSVGFEVRVQNTGNTPADVEVLVANRAGTHTKTVPLAPTEKKTVEFEMVLENGDYETTVVASFGGYEDRVTTTIQVGIVGKGLLNAGATYLEANANKVFAILLAIVLIGVGAILLTPTVVQKKHPFKSREHWLRAMRMRHKKKG